MLFNQPPQRGFQQPLYPQNQHPMYGGYGMEPPNTQLMQRYPQQQIQPQQKAPQPPKQKIRMFAPPGGTQPVQGFNPFINANTMNTEKNGLRDTISTLFGNKSRTNAGAGATVGATIASTSATIFSSINGVLDNVQKATQIAQNVKPAVERFAPMVKNLPSLLKIYKEVNTEDSSKDSPESTVKEKETKKEVKIEKKQPIPSSPSKHNRTSSKKQTTQKRNNGPRMYI